MNVNNLYGTIGNSSLTNVGNIGAVGPSSVTGSVAPTTGAAASATISTPGQFFSEMQQLSQQNPAEFKAVAAQVATTFQNAASQASGPQAQFLNNLANQLNQAAQTGTLQPPQGAQAASGVQGAQGSGGAGGHHHHHHHGGGSASRSSAVQQAFQSAMNILGQTTQATSTLGSSASSSP